MNQHHYDTVAKAIDYIQSHFRQQPDLDEVAAHVNLSPFHFQRMFSEWAGVSPKKFLQYISVQYAKSLLTEPRATLFDAADATGLSGTGRLHDLFIRTEAMTPGEYKNGGEALTIQYTFHSGAFGDLLLAATTKGICHLHFITDRETAWQELRRTFPHAHYVNASTPLLQSAIACIDTLVVPDHPIHLHIKGTPFQLKVWEALLRIPFGAVTSYGKLAAELGQPTASRAVGTAIGDNPVAFLIPCHRVLQSSGKNGGYRWGIPRKSLLLGKEALAIDPDTELSKQY